MRSVFSLLALALTVLSVSAHGNGHGNSNEHGHGHGHAPHPSPSPRPCTPAPTCAPTNIAGKLLIEAKSGIVGVDVNVDVKLGDRHGRHNDILACAYEGSKTCFYDAKTGELEKGPKASCVEQLELGTARCHGQKGNTKQQRIVRDYYQSHARRADGATRTSRRAARLNSAQ